MDERLAAQEITAVAPAVGARDREAGNSQFFDVNGVSFSYKNHKVIHEVTLSVSEGEIRGVIGPNGAGKTTLIKLLSGEVRPDEGSILLGGKEIKHLRPFQRRGLGISRSFQITNILLDHTVFENVRLAVQSNHRRKYAFLRAIDRMDDITAETLLLLEQCQLKDVKDKLCVNLSYAEQRQVEIALSLAGNPKLLLLDEPTAGLSKEESRQVALMVSNLAKEHRLTVILIEHDMDIVFSITDYISVIYYGRVLVEGTPEQIKTNSKVKEVYLGEQSDE